MAIAHFAFGSALTILALTYLVPNVPYPRVLALLGGIWAMIPDAHWISPVFESQLDALHGSAWANVFWFHRALDRTDTTDSKTVAVAFLAVLVVATVLAERRSYRALAPIREYVEDSDTASEEE
ncbi:MAG: hypothetical protein ABEI57_05340 [Halapricum sp.]